MRGKRLKTSLRLWTMLSAGKRTRYLREKQIFARLGQGSVIMDRAVPLYPELIRIGNNVQIASNVHFVTHDIAHVMINRLPKEQRDGKAFQEQLGCIEIGDNVFIGAGTRILYNVRIGSNCVIGADSLVNKDIPDNSVAAGIPAKVIGTFEDFLKKRSTQEGYPQGLRPKRESVPPELAEWLWRRFDEQRKEP